MQLRGSLRLLLAFAIVIPVAFGSVALAQGPAVVTGLENPRGLTGDGSRVLIAEQGTGRILRVSGSGEVTVAAEGLPSTIAETSEGLLPAGPNAVIRIGDTYYVTVGEGPEGFDSVYSVRTGGEPVLVADLGAYEEANNLDGGVEDGEPDLLANPYDLVSDGAGGLYVSLSGANAVVHISADGEISPFAIFPGRPNPTDRGPNRMDQVPTGLEVGPDGALYVTTLTGFPFPSGAARIYRMQDLNGDGDARDPGETTVFVEGLTMATNLVFDEDGSILVTELSTNILAGEPGRLVRVVDGEIAEVVAEPLDTPTGVAILRDGQILVSQEFPGIVAEAREAAAITARESPPEAVASAGPADQGISPPSAGSAGLLEAGSGSPWWTLALFLTLTPAAAFAGRKILAGRRL